MDRLRREEVEIEEEVERRSGLPVGLYGKDGPGRLTLSVYEQVIRKRNRKTEKRKERECG